MPDVSSNASAATTRTFVALDVHKNSITAALLPVEGGQPELVQLEHSEKAIRRFVRRLGDPRRLAVCYEAGPCGYELYWLLAAIGVACDIVAPSLTPVRPGDRVKTDRRDAKKLVRLYRAGELTFVAPPTPEQEGLRDLVRCRDDLRRARTAARHRVGKQLLRYGCIYREGKNSWTLRHRAWVRRQRLDDPLAQSALEQMLLHLDAIDAQIAAIDRQLDAVAKSEPWCDPVRWLCCFRGISTLTALGLLAEIGDFRRPRADELPRPDRERVLLRRAALPRLDHQRPATATPAACSSRPPGTTSTRPGSPAGPERAASSSRPRRSPAPGRPRSASTSATAT